MGFIVTAVDSHRNGVGGVPFHVAIVQDEDEGRRFLVIDFMAGESHDPHTAVLDLDQAHAGNIYMHAQLDEDANAVPNTGDNAWRGDRMGDQYRAAIQRVLDDQRNVQITRWLQHSVNSKESA